MQSGTFIITKRSKVRKPSEKKSRRVKIKVRRLFLIGRYIIYTPPRNFTKKGTFPFNYRNLHVTKLALLSLVGAGRGPKDGIVIIPVFHSIFENRAFISSQKELFSKIKIHESLSVSLESWEKVGKRGVFIIGKQTELFSRVGIFQFVLLLNAVHRER